MIDAPLEIFDCEQNTPAWDALRMGLATASEFHAVCARGVDRRSDSKIRRVYLNRLAGERISGVPAVTYQSAAMRRGHELEDEARQIYQLMRDVTCERGGFMRRENLGGCSPDSKIGHEGLVEIKTCEPHLQVQALVERRLPPRHVDQIVGQFLISGRAWIDFVSYSPALPLFVKRLYREQYEKEMVEMSEALMRFNAELGELVAYLRAYRNDPI